MSATYVGALVVVRPGQWFRKAADTVSRLTPAARASSARLRYRPSASHCPQITPRWSFGTECTGSTFRISRHVTTRTTF